ncbi:MAG: DUF547 domain-containing protein [Maribacter sp.]
MIKKLLIGIFCSLTVFVANAQELEEYFSQTDAFFKTYVEDGKVDYKGIVKNITVLDSLLVLAIGIKVSKENASEYQAFWINSYNLLVIKSVVDNYPIKSPLEIAGFFDKTTHEICGIPITLNDIEHKLLRGIFPNEPRYHFVLVCAGLGCPPIINKAYLPSTLEVQLEQQTRLTLNDPDFISIHKNMVKVSRIFEWYEKDFTRNGQKLIDFINRYRTEKLQENSKISFYEYDWSLNEIKQ